MRVIDCIVTQHNLWFVLLAAITCAIGSAVTVRLWWQAKAETGRSRYDWCFLSGVVAGASIWATHFIAILGYQPSASVTFNPALTLASIGIAIAGSAIGFLVTLMSSRLTVRIAGGATIGLSVAAMHYVGMFAYRVDGIVSWDPLYLWLSLVAATSLSVLSILSLGLPRQMLRGQMPAVILMLAIVCLHFLGMAAFGVTPLSGISVGIDSDAFSAMALAVAFVAMLIVGTGISSFLIDDRARASSETRLHHMASHDALTGIANRQHFNATLALRCAALECGGTPFAVLAIDLDRFKPVNDSHGHQVGDEVLRRVAARLETALGGAGTIGRIGGDEFAALVDDVAQAEEVARRTVEILGRPFLVNGMIVDIGASVGIALAPRHATAPGDLLRDADVALYAAKEAGRAAFRMFEDAMVEEMQARIALEQDLRRAVAREEFRLFFQPQVDSRTGAFTGAEALLRWNHATRGMVSPAVFIPLAEQLGLIGRIGKWVLQTACEEAAGWEPHLTIAVNLSPMQLADPRLPRTVSQILQETGLPPARLELEITETALLGNDQQALASLGELRRMGVMISLDDFGTGYSSLSYLHRFPIDRIKIDRSFISGVATDPHSATIVRAIAHLGANLGLKITAEGIEDDGQRDFSTLYGCDNLQGFLFSKPLPAESLKSVLASRKPQAA
ncbi:MAG: EAL domain-containing protein [Methylobacterium mesophilicum]|nr:EAL domain-containing protein [Methylobacterium mesophilicum]